MFIANMLCANEIKFSRFHSLSSFYFTCIKTKLRRTCFFWRSQPSAYRQSTDTSVHEIPTKTQFTQLFSNEIARKLDFVTEVCWMFWNFATFFPVSTRKNCIHITGTGTMKPNLVYRQTNKSIRAAPSPSFIRPLHRRWKSMWETNEARKGASICGSSVCTLFYQVLMVSACLRRIYRSIFIYCLLPSWKVVVLP